MSYDNRDIEAYNRMMKAKADAPPFKSVEAYGDLPDLVPENKFRFEVVLLSETEKAYKLQIDGNNFWVPKGHAVLGWAQGVTAADVLFCADLTAWIVDNKKLL